MQRFEDPTKAIRAAVGETFAVALSGNPTTGYTWQSTVDPGYLELASQTFEPTGEGIGAAGQEVFFFRALAIGRAEINCEYRRPWDKKPRESLRFRIEIA